MLPEPLAPPADATTRAPSPDVARVLNRGLVVIAALLTLLAAANVGFALVAPLELEPREGTVWLHVLAERSGLSLYDHTRTAFVNMNHGPLDPWLKGRLSTLLPWLPAQVVTRGFVVLLPIALWLAFRRVTGRSLAATAWAGGTYVFLLGFGVVPFLVGRSDATGLCWLAAELAVGLGAVTRSPAERRGVLRTGALVGLLAQACFLTTSRYAPVAFGAACALGLEWVATAPAGERRRAALGYAVSGGTAAVALFAGVIATLFHGDLGAWYRHDFGVFSQASGWGTAGRMPFEFLPWELERDHWILHLGLVAALALAARRLWSEPAGAWRVTAWAVVLGAAWVTLGWAFARNHGGGGTYYFAPVYVAAALVAAAHAPTQKPRAATVATAALLLAALPWSAVAGQAIDLRTTAHAGRAFLQEVRTEVARAPENEPYSEDVHLFRTRYTGEVIDVGDMAAAVAATGYLGPEFSALVQQHAAALAAHPPADVLVGSESVVSPTLRALLRARYHPIRRMPPTPFGVRATLYGRRDPVAPH